MRRDKPRDKAQDGSEARKIAKMIMKACELKREHNGGSLESNASTTRAVSVAGNG